MERTSSLNKNLWFMETVEQINSGNLNKSLQNVFWLFMFPGRGFHLRGQDGRPLLLWSLVRFTKKRGKLFQKLVGANNNLSLATLLCYYYLELREKINTRIKISLFGNTRKWHSGFIGWRYLIITLLRIVGQFES